MDENNTVIGIEDVDRKHEIYKGTFEEYDKNCYICGRDNNEAKLLI